MNSRRLAKIVNVSLGKAPADLVVRNCQIVDPVSQTIAKGDIAIYDGYIVGVGEYRGESEFDAKGAFATSGLIDSHVHIESSLVTPEEYAAIVVPRGTTTVIADPHEISNVKGIDGINFMQNSARRAPLKVHFMASSCVPATDFEDSGAILDSDAIEDLLKDPKILGLGEMMNAPGLFNLDSEVLEKICLAINFGKVLDGHGPALQSKFLNAYRAAGITTDHECVNADEVRARIKRGMWVLLRQGSAAQNLRDLLPGVSESSSRRCAMCSDDKHPGDILREGHINHNLRIAVQCGISPFSAIAMATINAAECFKLKNIGLIAPGYRADIALFDDLKDFNARAVFIDGVQVAENGIPLFEVSNRVDKAVTHSVNIKPLTERDLQIPLKTRKARFMRLKSHDLVTQSVVREVATKNGFFAFDDKIDAKKMVVVERHKATGKIGLALVENYGIRGGAVATTIAHDSHNMIVIGDSDSDILLCIRELEQVGGGITFSHKGKIVATLELPIGGIMSDKNAREVSEKLDKMIADAQKLLQINPEINPFMTLSFLSLPVIPQIKLTPRGLFDVEKFAFCTSDAE